MKALALRAQARRGTPRPHVAGAPGARPAAPAVGPLRLRDVDPPELPGPGWVRVRPRLAGICGCDLATIDGTSSRYFEPIVSFPFVPGHEVVADLDDDRRVVLEPVLGCVARGIDPPCAACARGDLGNCERIAFGHLEPGLQTGFCGDTGGGWSHAHGRPREPAPRRARRRDRRGRRHGRADRVRRARRAARPASPRATSSWSSAPARSACSRVAALRRFTDGRHDRRRRQAPRAAPPGRRARRRRRRASPASCPRLVRRAHRLAWPTATQLTGGADAVVDCVGSRRRRSPQSLAVVTPRGRRRAGRHARPVHARPHRRSGTARPSWPAPTPTAPRRWPTAGGRAPSTSPSSWCAAADLGRLVSATYPLARYSDAIEHAANAGRRGAVKIAFDLRDERTGHGPATTLDRYGSLMPRPGFVLDVDRSTPPILFHHGEGFRLEKLPAGRARVIYPAEPLDAARGHRRRHPPRAPQPDRQRPAARAAVPGHEAHDRLRRHLAAAAADARPDIRQRVIEAVLDLAADAGVDDVHLIAALALHRRMTEDELRHAVGDRVYDAFAPRGLLYNHDAEDPDDLAFLGTTAQGEEVEINKRAAESDLLVYVNINLVAMDGGWKSTATGLASYRSLRHHHNVQTMQHSRVVHGPGHARELHSSNWRMGKVLRDAGVKVFQIETTLNNDTFADAVRRPAEARVGVDAARPGHVPRDREERSTACRHALARKIFQAIEAPHEMTSVQAGEVEAVHEVTTANVYEQQLVPVEGQTDILTMGLPYICPYNVNSIMNPILVMCLGLGYFFNLYRGKPLVREGGVLIMSHPTPWEFHPVHHPSYIDFFEQVLAETTDPSEIEAEYEKQFAEDEWYRHLYRTSYAYHGVHPFYMWYWGAHALQHLGRVIIVGGDAAGRAPARLQAGVDAGRRARDGDATSSAATRRSPTCTTRRSSWPT